MFAGNRGCTLFANEKLRMMAPVKPGQCLTKPVELAPSLREWNHELSASVLGKMIPTVPLQNVFNSTE